MTYIILSFLFTFFIIFGIFTFFQKKGSEYLKESEKPISEKNEKKVPILIKKKRKPETIIIRPLHELPNGEIIEEKKEIKITIAPNNSILDFLEEISKDFLLLGDKSEIEVPKVFTWKGKADISKVFNQFNCGCCWSIGVSQTINDMFITGKSPILDKNPSIPPTQLLNCYKGGQCEGDNPLKVLKWIEKNGISIKDINYDWCKKDILCTDIFGKKKPSPIDLQYLLNQKIPDCPSKKSNLKFYIKDVKHPHIGEDEEDIEKKAKILQIHMKEHIFLKGPVVGGIVVYRNLLKSNFLKKGNKKAIYFDSYDYNKDEYDTKEREPIGLHTVSIIGWGVDNVDGKFFGKEDGKLFKVGYWIVRNSWGKNWGIEGYFHLAMYPFNKKCQLEVSKLSSKKKFTGGFLKFEPSLTPTYPSVESFEKKEELFLSFYQIIIIFIFIFLILFKIFYI